MPEYDRLMGDIEGTEQALSRFCRERVERLQKELEALGQSAAFTRPSHTLTLLEKEIGQQAVTMEHGLRQALLAPRLAWMHVRLGWTSWTRAGCWAVATPWFRSGTDMRAA